MSHLNLVESILTQIRETQDVVSLISVSSLKYDKRFNTLIIIFKYQLISKNRNIDFTMFINNINDKTEIDNKTRFIINQINNAIAIRLKI